MRVVGAGVGRTGTMSLKKGLERLLDGPCYHMMEVFPRPDHVPQWHSACVGEMPDWKSMFSGFVAAVDWPAGAFWSEISDAYPDALIVLSVRDPEKWWDSASQTIFPSIEASGAIEDRKAWKEMLDAMMLSRFTPNILDKASAIEAFERHNDDVRRRAPAGRLLEWRASDGWEPLCAALDLPVPQEPFPWENDRETFKAHVESVKRSQASGS